MATPRSRSPRREAVGGFFSAASAAWSAATNALKSKVQGKKSETDETETLTARESLPKNEGGEPQAQAAEDEAKDAAPEDEKGDADATDATDANDANDAKGEKEPEASTVQCFGCGQRFKAPELQAHLESSEQCLGAAWQVAVNAIGCMPGAGTTLWCPACPDAFLGKWTGSISKASALLRHVASASKTGVPECAPNAHAWFLTAFVALLLSSPPPPTEEDAEVDESAQEMRLQEWISSSPPLVNIVGPLLAKPGPQAREAVRAELEDSESAPWPFGAVDAGVEVKKAKKSKKPKVSSEAPGYDLYNEDIPMDVFMACEDHTRRTSDGVPVLDLLSSDEDELTQL